MPPRLDDFADRDFSSRARETAADVSPAPAPAWPNTCSSFEMGKSCWTTRKPHERSTEATGRDASRHSCSWRIFAKEGGSSRYLARLFAGLVRCFGR